MCSPSTLFFVLSQRSGPWGWILSVPRGLCSGPPRQQKRRRVCNLSLHRQKLNTHSHFSRLNKPWLFDKMDAAQVSCCVGGRVSCIGSRGVAALLGLPLFAFAVSQSIFYTKPLDCASGFFLYEFKAAFFCCQKNPPFLPIKIMLKKLLYFQFSRLFF